MLHNVDLIQRFPYIHQVSMESEKNVFSAPRTSLFYARVALERAVKWLYANDDYLKRPTGGIKDEPSLYDLMYEQTFRDNLDSKLFQPIDLVRRLGNQAVHDDKVISVKDALLAFQNLHQFLFWLQRYYSEKPVKVYFFDPELLPKAGASDKSAYELEQLRQQNSKQEDQMEKIQRENDVLRQQLLTLKESREERQTSFVPQTEKETRIKLIDLMLEEAGWNIGTDDVGLEVQLFGMPNSSGIGFADYVLYDDNKKPLAVVEAKKTSFDPRKGKEQAYQYAQIIEKNFGQFPIIYYTNGINLWSWDEADGYPSRKVTGFLTKDQMRLRIQRRLNRKSFDAVPINNEIAGRYYQISAIQATCDYYLRRRRRALLTMATGAGKTRTAVALVDVLLRAGWIKNVLFLADRTELVHQAQNAFKTQLPDVSSANLLEQKSDRESRIIFSTYQTMLGLLGVKNGHKPVFTTGHFDLIIIDESHRSIYRKFGMIFDYYDCLLVGLTATPKTDVDKNTYQFFELENDIPTYNYDLKQAVEDNYLVEPIPVKTGTKFLSEGIRYSELTPKEQAEYEMKFTGEEGELPESIDSESLNKWLFNKDTVDQCLASVMDKGLKWQGGDIIGKTIIFAKNHNHAVFIKDRFDAMYPHLGGRFAEVIDNQVNYVQSLINDFRNKSKLPMIAISVDMLDTGIDVPEILNLVMLKKVRSKSKFWQMIGRGTRLSPNLLGPGKDKEYFRLFDFLGNLDYFEAYPEGEEVKAERSLTEDLFTVRAKLVFHLQELTDETLQELRSNLIKALSTEVYAVDPNNLLVRPHLLQWERFSTAEGWNHLSRNSLNEAIDHLSSIAYNEDPEEVKRFDLLMYRLMLSLHEPAKQIVRTQNRVRQTAEILSEKNTIPQIQKHIALLEKIQKKDFWESVAELDYELVRDTLRDLIQFLDKSSKPIIYTDFKDELTTEVSSEIVLPSNPKAYRDEISAYLKKHESRIVLQKLRTGRQLTDYDLQELDQLLFEEGTFNKVEIEQLYGSDKPLINFIRQILGMDRNAALEAFSEFLIQGAFNQSQIHFVQKVIDYFEKNGQLDPGLLYEPPFKSYAPRGDVEELFGLKTDRLFEIINKLNYSDIS